MTYNFPQRRCTCLSRILCKKSHSTFTFLILKHSEMLESSPINDELLVFAMFVSVMCLLEVLKTDTLTLDFVQ